MTRLTDEEFEMWGQANATPDNIRLLWNEAKRARASEEEALELLEEWLLDNAGLAEDEQCWCQDSDPSVGISGAQCEPCETKALLKRAGRR